MPTKQRKLDCLKVIVLITLSGLSYVTASRKSCPIGFTLVHTKENSVPICYRLKGPETFNEKFIDCIGNLYSSELLSQLSFTPAELLLWADFKSLYPGGPFIDWSLGETNGNLLERTFDVGYQTEQGTNEEFCTTVNPKSHNLTAVSCYERHHRYCFLPPYEDLILGDCEDGYKRVPSGWPACLQRATGAGGARVRATWTQAQGLCAKRNGSLIQRAWRYANHPDLRSSSSSDWTSPLGIQIRKGDGLHWLVPDETGDDSVPERVWNFAATELFPPESDVVALHDGTWLLVNETNVFYDVICEMPVTLPMPRMFVKHVDDGKLVLNVTETDLEIDEEDLYCYTDSETYYPSNVKMTEVDRTSIFILKPITDGYYWCITADNTDFKSSESNKALFIREKQSIINLYSIKLRIKGRYNLDNLERLARNMNRKLSEYILLTTKYLSVFHSFETLNSIEKQKVLKEFKNQNSISSDREDVIYSLKVKRIFLDRRTLLLHVDLNAKMIPLISGPWEDFEIVFMRPAYYCQSFEDIPMAALGETLQKSGCRTYTCVGDFNEGVQWVESITPSCSDELPRKAEELNSTVEFRNSVNTETTLQVPDDEEMATTTDISYTEVFTEASEQRPTRFPPISSTEDSSSSSSSEENSVEVTTAYIGTTPPCIPPPMNRPPQEQVNVIIEHLEDLLNDGNVTINEGHLNSAADSIDEILDFSDEIEIPGRLLQMIDEMATRAEFNGSSVTAVRDNIALLVANSAPDAPVRGLRLSVRDADQLDQDSLQIISDEIDASHLDTNTSEVVVNLPESLVLMEHRVSFLVFRTDRAFMPNPNITHPPVNSRVLSVTVSNVTHFDEGETIDIHLRPLEGNISRDARRACAYWHFLEDGTGYWSQDGCEFIPATVEGSLDTCRCTHLTHFAEILAPRAVFSESNESALEIISLIGCVLSILGILSIILTASLFTTWRRDFNNKIWLQLVIADLLLIIMFLVAAFVKFDGFSKTCMFVGVMLHYFVLTSFFWTVVAAVLSYRRLVLVFSRDASHKLLRACAFAWGAPFAIIGILLAVDSTSYYQNFEEMIPGATFCYPSGTAFYVTVLGPIMLALIVNWTLFALIVRSLFMSRRIQRHGDTGEALRCATVSFLLVFLFGLPWIFGIFSDILAFAYLFNLTATYQGLVLFVFFVVGNKKTRDLWLNKLKIKQKRMVPVTSSTYKSSGWRGATSSGNTPSTSGVMAAEANYVKPRSLAGQDDISRFS